MLLVSVLLHGRVTFQAASLSVAGVLYFGLPFAHMVLLRAADAMDRIANLDEKYGALAGRLREIYYAAQDAGYELQAMMDGLEFDPGLIDRIAGEIM